MSPLRSDDSTSADSGQDRNEPPFKADGGPMDLPPDPWKKRPGNLLDGNLPPHPNPEKYKILTQEARGEEQKVEYLVRGSPANIATCLREWAVWRYEQTGDMPLFFGGLHKPQVRNNVEFAHDAPGDSGHQGLNTRPDIAATLQATFKSDTLAIIGIRIGDLTSVMDGEAPTWYLGRYRRKIEEGLSAFVGPGYATMDLVTRESDPAHPRTAIVLKLDPMDWEAYESVVEAMLDELARLGFAQVPAGLDISDERDETVPEPDRKKISSGYAPKGAPGRKPDELFDWAFQEIYVKGRDHAIVYNEWLPQRQERDARRRDLGPQDHPTAFDAAMRYRKRKYAESK